MSGRPLLDFSKVRFLCDRHQRESLNMGFTQSVAIHAMTKLIWEAASRPDIKREAGGNPDDPNRPADTAKLPEIFKRHEPICCFLGDDVTTRVFRDSMNDYREKVMGHPPVN